MSARIMITLPDVKGPSAVFYRNSLKIASNAWTKVTLCPCAAVPANRSLVFFHFKMGRLQTLHSNRIQSHLDIYNF